MLKGLILFFKGSFRYIRSLEWFLKVVIFGAVCTTISLIHTTILFGYHEVLTQHCYNHLKFLDKFCTNTQMKSSIQNSNGS